MPRSSAVPAGTSPACQPDQYRLTVSTEGETSAGIGVAALPVYVKGPACALTVQAELSLLDSTGKLLAVTGNPITATISGEVSPTAEETTQFPNAFFWSNWCGARSPDAQFRIRLPGTAVGVNRTAGAPICITPGAGSNLTVIAR